jgi:hypothetical protein
MSAPSRSNFLSRACGLERIAQRHYINTSETRVSATVRYSSFQINQGCN